MYLYRIFIVYKLRINAEMTISIIFTYTQKEGKEISKEKIQHIRTCPL
jgi:hypothetical protein